MPNKVTELPGNIALNLDEEEVEYADPLPVLVGGKTITFQDPDKADWQELAGVSTPYDFLRICLSKEDREHLLAQDLVSGKKFNRLMEVFSSHFGIEDRLAEARRQAQRLGR